MEGFMKTITLASNLGCDVIIGEILQKYTTMKIGGACQALIKVNQVSSFSMLIKKCTEYKIPYFILGKGSNLLVSDNGFIGIVFLMGCQFSEIRKLNDTTITCEAGTPLAKLCYFAYKNDLSGLEFAWGIPGTVGGALFMNAGAYDGEMQDVVISAAVMDNLGNEKVFTKEQMELSYRNSIFCTNNHIITNITVSLEKGDSTKIREKMDDLLNRRKSKQPMEFPSAGSTFKRPEGSYASLLIEQCGLKGLKIGGAEVSSKHSGFIINTGDATFNDVIKLIERVKEIVKKETGYLLECEPKILKNPIIKMDNDNDFIEYNQAKF